MKSIYEQSIENKDFKDFSGYRYGMEALPADKLADAARYVMDNMGSEALQYSATDDYMPLKAIVAQNCMKTARLSYEKEEIQILTGSVQIFELLVKALLDIDDYVVMETPCREETVQFLETNRVNVITWDYEGTEKSIHKLSELLCQYQPKLFVASEMTPVCGEEEDFYAQIEEMLYCSSCIPVDYFPDFSVSLTDAGKWTLQKKYQSGILVGSFSTILGGGYRLGWIACKNKEIATVVEQAKRSSDNHTNGLTQRIMWKLLSDMDMEECVSDRKAELKRKTEYFESLLARKNGIKWKKCKSGFEYLLFLPEKTNAEELSQRAYEQKILIVPLRDMATAEDAGLYISLKGTTEEEIKALAGFLESNVEEVKEEAYVSGGSEN